MMATINNQGMLIDLRIQARRFPSIEHGTLTQVHAVVVHQTDSSSEQATFNAYVKGPNGAHSSSARAERSTKRQA
jgi:hypothetical protein